MKFVGVHWITRVTSPFGAASLAKTPVTRQPWHSSHSVAPQPGLATFQPNIFTGAAQPEIPIGFPIENWTKILRGIQSEIKSDQKVDRIFGTK